MVSSDLFAYNPALYSLLWPESVDSDYDRLLDELASAIPETTPWSNRRPSVGDLVFGQRLDGDWIRGYVISVLPYLKLAMIDEARLVMVTNLATCNKPISDLYAFSGICELSDVTHKFKEGEVFQFKVTGQTNNEEQDGFEILVFKGNFALKATVKPWIPMPEQLGVPCADVTNGSEVCVTGYRNHIHLYVRPLDTLGLARYSYVMRSVAKCAFFFFFSKAPFLKEPPAIGHMVLAQSVDGKYYRAYVTKVRKDKVQVMYHDLGCTEYVDRQKLKIFPDHLKKLGYAMSKVQLRGVPPDIPPLIPIIEILDNLVKTKVTLICTYDGIPTIDGVYLKYPDGESVNNMICNCLVPNPWEPPE